MDIELSTLDVCLRARALQSPDVEVFTFLEDGGLDADILTYRELDRRARAIAATIRSRAGKGQRVLLLFAPGLDFIAALYGCFYAGAVAVPAYPPEPSRIERTLPRLQAIVRDADPSLVLTTAPILEMARHIFTILPDIAALDWVAVDKITARGDAPDHLEAGSQPQDLALIQYTSGSTSMPKGVMVSHRNILVNMWMIQKAAAQDERHIVASWLPHGHDLGLMGGIFLPVILGGRSVLMSPLDFLKRPMAWLSAIQRYRATDTFVPNFALDLCVRKTSSNDRKELDLSSLELCVVAAEPVRHGTVERFLRTFEKHGFPRKGLIPGYGLAEAVVAVTGGPYGEVQSTFVDTDRLAQNRFVEVGEDHPRALPLVACGQPFEKVEVEIVNPETCAPCGPGEVGEVWIGGPSVALGYWRKEEQTRETFGAHLAGGEDRRLVRTGDLGYRKGEQLYILGRIKDLIIIRGRNYYPQDIELTAEHCHTRVRPGGVIAFGIDHGGVERVVVVAEVDARQLGGADERRQALDAVITSIRVAVNAEHGLQVHGVALVKARTIDKTSSGKPARRACRKRYLEKALDTELTWNLSDLSIAIDEGPLSAGPVSQEGPRSVRGSFATALSNAPPAERLELLMDYLAREISRLAAAGSDIGLTPETRLQEIGLDSLSAMDLAGRIEKDLGVKLSVVSLIDTTSLGALVDHLLDSMQTDEPPPSRGFSAPGTLPPPSSPLPASVDLATFNTTAAALRKTWPALGDLGPPSSRQGPPSSRQGPPSVRWLRPQTLPPGSFARPAFTQAVALRGLVSQPPVFCVGGLAGTIPYLMPLSSELGAPYPFIAFQAPGVDGAEIPLGSVEEMARRYLEEVRSLQPAGPYVLAGHSFGGLVAYEMAQRLGERGEEVKHLFLIDSSPADGGRGEAARGSEADDIMAMFELVNIFRRVSGQEQGSLSYAQIAAMGAEEQRLALAQYLGSENGLLPGTAVSNIVDVYMASFGAMERYRPVLYPGAVTVLRAEKELPPETMHPARKLRMCFDDPSLGWQRLCPALRVVSVPGDHFSMVLPPHVQSISAVMRASLAGEAYLEVGLDRILAAKGPQRVAGRPIEVSRRGVAFNPFHTAFIDDPYPMLHQLRESDPVHWSSISCWWVTRHADVTAGLRDKRFSVDSRNWVDRAEKGVDVQTDSVKPSVLTSWFRRQTDLPLAQLYNNIMMFLDPPRHQRLRRLLAPAFEPAVIRRWKEFTDEHVTELLADMRRRSDPDVIRDLALPLPISVISEILGVPPEDASFLRRWSYDLTQAFDPFLSNDIVQRANTTAADFMRYIHEHVARRRGGSPRNDLLSLMIEAGTDGDRLTTDELVANCVLLFLAGFETTTNVIGNGVLALLRNPDQLKLLRERPEVAENAVEELLRYDGAGRQVFRTALEDVEIGDKLIRRGESVFFVLPAANRDPAVFPDPDRLDLERNAKPQVAFGHGAHYCLGASLARLEIQSVITALSRYNFELVPGGFDWRQSLSFRGLERLRITFTS